MEGAAEGKVEGAAEGKVQGTAEGKVEGAAEGHLHPELVVVDDREVPSARVIKPAAHSALLPRTAHSALLPRTAQDLTRGRITEGIEPLRYADLPARRVSICHTHAFDALWLTHSFSLMHCG